MKSRTTSIFSHIFVKNQLKFSKKLFSNNIIVSNVNISNKSSTIFSTPYNSFFMKNSHRYFSKKIMPLPKMGDSISDATIQKYFKNVGDLVKEDEDIAVVETEKLTVNIKSQFAGKITQLYAKENDKLDVGANFVEIDTSVSAGAAATEAPKQAQPQTSQPQQPQPTQPQSQPQPTPQTPPQEAKKESPKPAAEKKAEPAKPVVVPPTFSGSRTERREPMSRMRQRIAERLKGSQNTNATLTTFNECDVSEIMNYRNQFQDEFSKKYGIKLGFMSFFLRASSIALQEFPVVNAVIDGNDIIYRDFIDISVAVAAPKGLMVPIIRNCENRGLADFELTLRDLSNKVRENKISIEEMVGGTFSVSNGGVYGSMLGTPIINPPQTAILGMHAITNRAVVRGEEIVARPMMYLALSYDHRLIDGREGVLFLKRVKDLVEDPRRIIVGL